MKVSQGSLWCDTYFIFAGWDMIKCILPKLSLTLLPWLLTERVDCRLFDSHIQKCQQCGNSKMEHNDFWRMEVVLEIGFRLCLCERLHLIQLKAHLWYYHHEQFHSRGKAKERLLNDFLFLWVQIFSNLSTLSVSIHCLTMRVILRSFERSEYIAQGRHVR